MVAVVVVAVVVVVFVGFAVVVFVVGYVVGHVGIAVVGDARPRPLTPHSGAEAPKPWSAARHFPVEWERRHPRLDVSQACG